MREIKFRAWDRELKKMDYASDGELGSFFDYGHDTIMQYTGLKDKNGKMIFESDIVKYENNHGESGIAEIKPIFDTCNMAYWWIKQSTPSPSMYTQCDYLACSEESEVIGNIHENPELLNE